jgi:hypothetical protein
LNRGKLSLRLAGYKPQLNSSTNDERIATQRHMCSQDKNKIVENFLALQKLLRELQS